MRRRKARCEIILFHLIVVVIFVISCGTAVDAVVTVKERGDECVRYLPKWISKDDVAILCKEGKVNYSGVVQCTRALRESDADIVKQLCTNSPSVAPAHCFHVSTRMREGNVTPSRRQLTYLCNAAESNAPYQCYTTTINALRHGKVKDHSVIINSAIELCRGAASQARTACISALPPWFSEDEEASMAVIQMCRMANDTNSSTIISKCYKSAPAPMKTLDRATLCSEGAEKAQIAMQCSRAAPPKMNSWVVLVLCSSGGDEAIKCAKMTDIRLLSRSPGALAPYATIDHLLIDLCVGSVSAAAECFNAIPDTLYTVERVQLCKGAESKGPAICASTLLPTSIQCPLKSHPVSQPRLRHLSTELVVNLCQGTVGSNTAECVASAPAFIEDKHLAILCGDDGTLLGNMASADCATAAPWGLGSEVTSLLCKKATSTAPAECAQQLMQRRGRCKFDTKTLLDLCYTALSSAPAACFCHPQHDMSRKSISNRVSDCKTSVSFANNLHVEHVASTHPSGIVYVGVPVAAKLSILDQWEQNMAGTDLLDPITVVASVETQGGSGADGGLLDHRGTRFNVSNNGIVYFESLMFTRPGNLTLLFSITNITAPGSTGRQPPSAAVKISVFESKNTPHWKECMTRLFNGLHSSLNPPPATSTQARGWINSSLKPILILTCQKSLESRGFILEHKGRGGKLGVQYHPGIELLHYNSAPRENMDPLEMLGLSEEASKAEIRKAYHRLALFWHPDRWQRFLYYAPRAQGIFAAVASAYSRLISKSSS